MSTRLHIVVSDELAGRIDAVRGDVPRSAWLRRAAERSLVTAETGMVVVGADEFPSGAVERALEGAGCNRPEDGGVHRSAPETSDPPAPAEQPEASSGRRIAEAVRDAGLRSAREFQGSYDPFKKR